MGNNFLQYGNEARGGDLLDMLCVEVSNKNISWNRVDLGLVTWRSMSYVVFCAWPMKRSYGASNEQFHGTLGLACHAKVD